ncbi:reticulocalbin-2-like [Ylistrum balloti]|uniref:reticulocalbin-2-like n=1 Tax=Ylistrum balloti TaxID=509963 RepID=UPI0029059D38|nr:reticulocalbin-2-like [Ylistrum balloti]
MKLLFYTMLLLACSYQSCGDQEHAQHGSHHVQSDSHHFDDHGEHNSHFDHEAILGSKELEEEFDTLAPEEAKKRLRLLYKQMDEDKDAFVTEEELMKWIMGSFKKLDAEDSLEEFEKQDKDEDGKMTWREYIGAVYGYNPEDMDDFHKLTDDDLEDFNKVVSEDEEKFKIADLNKDEVLDAEEYRAFTHPYDYEHMHEIELTRAQKDYDKDGDGHISKQEFVKRDGDADREIEIYEEEQFSNYDTDGDGKLNREEIVEWVLPSNREAALEEAQHLMERADTDKDGKLSEEEMVDKHDEFVGSQATNYGGYLPKDEL